MSCGSADAGLARGYLNRPEQTAEKFVAHPRFGRIYRTGDLVHRASGGALVYHGRADTQVKIRGYRIELEEIEMRLTAMEGVRSAACTVQDGVLAAFVVPENEGGDDRFERWEVALRRVLPDHMVPSRFAAVTDLPLTAGGKLNRSALPVLPEEARSIEGLAPRNAREIELAAAVRDVLGLNSPVPVDADFFTDLGGNSLRAAQFLTLLRERDASTPLTVRDIYEARTVSALAERATPAPFAARTERAAGWRPSAVVATIVQAAWLLSALSLVALAGSAGALDAAPALIRTLGLMPTLVLSPLLFYVGVAAWAPIAIAIAVFAKRCLIGPYRPLRAPVWGSFYVRNWIVQQTARTVPWWLLEGTGFQTVALRALGARVGKRVHIHRGVDLTQGGWDLLEIGDDVTIGQDVNLGLVDLEEGDILVRPIHLGSGCTLETRAGMAGDSQMEDGAQLSALSWLPPGARIPAGQRWDGIPAKPAGFAPALPATTPGISPRLHDVLMLLARCLCSSVPAMVVATTGAVADSFLGLGAALAVLALSVPLALAIEAAMVRALGRVPEGAISRWSLRVPPRAHEDGVAGIGGRMAGRLALLDDVATRGRNEARPRLRDQHDSRHGARPDGSGHGDFSRRRHLHGRTAHRSRHRHVGADANRQQRLPRQPRGDPGRPQSAGRRAARRLHGRR